MSHAHQITSFPAIRQYVLAGAAVFTLANEDNGHRVTYKVTRKPTADKAGFVADDTWFVGFLSGPDNEADYTYLGLLSNHACYGLRLWQTRASRLSKDSEAWKGAEWLVKHLADTGDMPAPMSFFMSSFCARCGRTLTTPESIVWGFGPECWKKMHEVSNGI